MACKAAMAFLFDNTGMWGACKEKEGREKGRTGAGAVKREGRSGTRVYLRLSEAKGEIKLSIDSQISWAPLR